MTLIITYLAVYVVRHFFLNPEDMILAGVVIMLNWAGLIEVEWPSWYRGRARC